MEPGTGTTRTKDLRARPLSPPLVSGSLSWLLHSLSWHRLTPLSMAIFPSDSLLRQG